MQPRQWQNLKEVYGLQLSALAPMTWGNPEIKGHHCGRQNDCLTPQMGPGTGPGVLSVGVLCYTAKGNHGRKWI